MAHNTYPKHLRFALCEGEMCLEFAYGDDQPEFVCRVKPGMTMQELNTRIEEWEE